MNETAKGFEYKNQETLKENRAIEYRQTRTEFCYTCAGIIMAVVSLFKVAG